MVAQDSTSRPAPDPYWAAPALISPIRQDLAPNRGRRSELFDVILPRPSRPPIVGIIIRCLGMRHTTGQGAVAASSLKTLSSTTFEWSSTLMFGVFSVDHSGVVNHHRPKVDNLLRCGSVDKIGPSFCGLGQLMFWRLCKDFHV